MPDPNARYLIHEKKLYDGTQWLYKFPNGFVVSVIDNGNGRQAGLKELAVWKEGDWKEGGREDMLVEGWMSDADIRQNLSRIRHQGSNAELAVHRAPRSRLGRVHVQPYIHWRS